MWENKEEMLITKEGLLFIKDYIGALNKSINKMKDGIILSRAAMIYINELSSD